MPTKILMPALSPTMTEGNLAKWHVQEGDQVSAGDVIAEIETDKATMEVEAIDDGVVARIVVPEGAEGVPVNDVIAMLAEEGEDPAALQDVDVGAAPSVPPVPEADIDAPERVAENLEGNGELRATPLARRVAAQAGVELSTVSGSGARGKIVMDDVVGAAAVSAEGAIMPSVSTPSGDRIFASPLARHMAAQAGLDLATIGGSGPDGRIIKVDIEAALAAPVVAALPMPSVATPTVAAPVSRVAAPMAEPARADADPFDLVKLTTMRRVIAERMTESKTTVPHFYLSMDCEIDELLRVRAELNRRAEPEKISVNDIVIRACALALREVPSANVGFEAAGVMRQHNVVDISVAVAIDGGLITPIVRNADTKGILEISRQMKDLAARARDGKLMPEEYQGGTFSISNLGMYGVKQFQAVINPPQACILAVGAGEPRPVVRDGEIVPATVMTCTLSVDHRVADGAIGAQLLAAIKRYLEYPPAMLL